MSLEEYRKQRHLEQTSEPKAKREPAHGSLRFVVHEHHASHPHYDLRLELGGVLKSWAVPKEISTDPKVKRLAIMVEDHPLAYRTFEGTIPQGNYGAGKVKIWDQGTYTELHGGSRHEMEAHLKKGLEDGHISVILKGTHLKGEFTLVRMKA
ncbi:MAG: DNA polymerase ligase N-terminal domain-containing protein, partial [Chlamydiia bacterium]